MTLRVAPDDLGPLTVRAHIDAAGVRIELFAPGDAGRDAVRHVLPELRRSLEDSGASLSLSSQNSPPDAGRDPGQGSGRDPGQGTGQGSGPGNGTRDPDTRTQGPGEQGPGERGTRTQGPNEQVPGEAGHEGADAQPQLPPGVVHRPGSPNRLDILA
ncbi:flagellar hook-length control protein FliK [Paenarthrobacter sp. AR 02]|nr:flagellar hook-length control protein FliK [Paenarthrobacter sp. AR 02]